MFKLWERFIQELRKTTTCASSKLCWVIIRSYCSHQGAVIVIIVLRTPETIKSSKTNICQWLLTQTMDSPYHHCSSKDKLTIKYQNKRQLKNNLFNFDKTFLNDMALDVRTGNRLGLFCQGVILILLLIPLKGMARSCMHCTK